MTTAPKDSSMSDEKKLSKKVEKMKVAPPPKRKLPAYLKEREDTWNTLKAKFDSETQGT